MLTCLLNGEKITSCDLERDNTSLEEIREASSKGNLSCSFCSNKVVLKAGSTKIIHFAHKNSDNDKLCSLSNNSPESSEHIKGKKMLYEYFLRDNSKLRIELEHILENGQIPDIYIETDNKKIVFEIQKSFIKDIDLRKRHDNYKKLGIIDYWFLLGNPKGKNKDEIIRLNNIENFMNAELIQKCILNLDLENKKVIMMKPLRQPFLIKKNLFFDDVTLGILTLNNLELVIDSFLKKYEDTKNFYNERILNYKRNICNKTEEEIRKCLKAAISGDADAMNLLKIKYINQYEPELIALFLESQLKEEHKYDQLKKIIKLLNSKIK